MREDIAPAPAALPDLPDLPAPLPAAGAPTDAVDGAEAVPNAAAPPAVRRRARLDSAVAPPPPSAPSPPTAPPPPTSPAAAPPDENLFLLRLRSREGRLVHLAGNTPFLLDDPEVVWVVYTGQVEVFAVRLEAGEAVGARQHLCSAPAGAALCGMDLAGRAVGLLVSGATGTQVLRVPRASLARLAEQAEFTPAVAALLDGWVERVTAGLLHDLPPRDFVALADGEERQVPVGGNARADGRVLWVTVDAGRARFLSWSDPALAVGPGTLPLAPRAWLEATEPLRLVVVDTLSALRADAVWGALDRFHALLLESLAVAATRQAQAARARLAETAQVDQERVAAACSRLTALLTPHRARVWDDLDARDPLLAACQLVGDALGVSMQRPATAPPGTAPLSAIARASGVRTRRVALRGAWWEHQSGPLLAYREADQQPVALLPASGGYELLDPVARTQERVTPDVAQTLGSFADMCYRPFEHRLLSARDLLAFGLRGCQGDLGRIVLGSLAIGLLGLLAPAATGALFDLVVPGAHRSLLLQIGAGLALAAVVTMLFTVARDIAVLRLSGRLELALESATMDRLLELPATFFRHYTAGDLAQRALGLSQIRETLSGAVLSGILSGVFSIVNFVMMFIYDRGLAVIALALLLILAVAFAISTRLQVGYTRRDTDLAGRLSGTVLELINGVPKLRVAGAETRAFGLWASRFAEQRQVVYSSRQVGNVMVAFNAAFPVLTTLVVFGVFQLALDPKPSIGSLMAFNAAFAAFVAAAISLIQGFASVLQIVPLYERASPIFQTLPEVDPAQADPGELSGAIEVAHVSFRYKADGPLILDDVSFRCAPGEFIALVGPSGSGKSTLLRLLLGFERPAAGAVLYDGQDLSTLDARAVRRQIGTVLQSSQVMVGDIFANIVGASPLTQADAWEACRLAGLDADVRQMPMGLQTMVSEGGSTLSGGQRQRLLIARAMVRRPRLIFFDEATSSLDNRTQEIVSRSLEGLDATRVVIAHRLSTIVNADRIYVLQQGRVVESGTYRELMQRRGLFASLARRQIA